MSVLVHFVSMICVRFLVALLSLALIVGSGARALGAEEPQAVQAPAASGQWQLRVAAWQADLDGLFAVRGWFQPLPGINLERVGVAPRNQQLVPSLGLHWRSSAYPLELDASGFWYRQRAAETATVQVVGGGLALRPEGQVPVAVRYDFAHAALDLRWRLWQGQRSHLALGPGLHAVYARVEPDDIAADLQLDELVLFPVLSLQGALKPWPWLEVAGEGRFIDVHLGHDQVRFIDARIQAAAELSAAWWLRLGYRYTSADVELGRVGRGLIPGVAVLDATLRGPFIGMHWQF